MSYLDFGIRDGNSNPFPQGLKVSGPSLPVLIQVPHQVAELMRQNGEEVRPPIQGMAMVDTGASATCVDRVSVESLGIQRAGVAQVASTTTVELAPLFHVGFSFPNINFPNMEFPAALGQNLANQRIPPFNLPLLVLLGRDFLSTCLLVYNGSNATWQISANPPDARIGIMGLPPRDNR
jgi:hypothetical protein